MNKKVMRAVGVVPQRREVRLLEHAAPGQLTSHQVRMRTLEVGVCGTDREICTFVYGSPPAGHDYLVLGHEGLGEVIETGPAVRRFKPGDLVVPSVRRPCAHDHCVPCRHERQDFCFTGDFVERGIKMVHGYMTESFVEEEKYLTFAPPELRDIAVLVEPLTVAEKGIAQVWQTQGRLNWTHPKASEKTPGHGRNAVVLGAGPIGILGAMALQVRGFKTYVYSRSEKPNFKADLVESFGVEYISARTTTAKQLADKVGNIDLVYEAVGEPQVAFDVMEHLGLNGAFVFTGIPAPHDPIPVRGHAIMKNLTLKNHAIIGTVNADAAAFQAAIDDLQEFKKRWPQAISRVITGRHKPDAYRELLLGKATGIKNVIAFD